MISVVVETWNVRGETAPLAKLLERLVPQLGDAELVITHAGIPAATRAELVRRPVTWVELPETAGYYDHKNRGFDASTGDVVAFIDGDCDPVDGWLAAITAPFADGAQVVAGATSYPGAVAELANAIDFPYFDEHARRQQAPALPRRAAVPKGVRRTVRNFFANNVAFARPVFAQRRYPTIAGMFHGQCQVLGLELLADGIEIRFVPDARVTHAWPDGLREWLAVRLLRGADTVSLLPYVLRAYAPRALPITKLGALPALALFGARAATATWTALWRGPRLRGLGFVAASTVLDAIGAAAAPIVYRLVA